jgi:hypothetical protein
MSNRKTINIDPQTHSRFKKIYDELNTHPKKYFNYSKVIDELLSIYELKQEILTLSEQLIKKLGALKNGSGTIQSH